MKKRYYYCQARKWRRRFLWTRQDDQQANIVCILERIAFGSKEDFVEPGQRANLPLTTYQLAEQYRVGQPLALYPMRPWWVRFCYVLRQVLLGTVICTVLFLLIVVAIFLYQYLTGLQNQSQDLQWRLILALPGIICGLMGCVYVMIVRYMIARRVPASLLVCTEGLLVIRPKEVDATRWNEVRGALRGPGFGKKKRYTLERINRKPLLFGESFEDIENLADLIRQHIAKRIEMA